MGYNNSLLSGTNDIAVVGGGPSGLTVASLLAKAGFKVVAFIPPPPSDTRTTALLRNSINLLKVAGIWSKLLPNAAPLNTMHIIDDTGRLPRAPSISFDTSTFGNEPFGFNIPNEIFTRELNSYAKTLTNLTLIQQKVDRIVPAKNEISVFSSGGQSVHRVTLVVGADGANSLCRETAQIACSKHVYDQTALAFNITHTLPHENASTEFHMRTGPFTLVPLPDSLSTSIVWVVRPAEAAQLLALPDSILKKKIEQRSHGILGDVTSIGPRNSFPLIRSLALQMAKNRIALVGDAGHILPPIGAQGLNLGFRDIASLVEILEDTARKGDDIGEQSILSAYDRRRQTDIATRANAIDLLNRIILSDFLPLQIARGTAIMAAKHCSFIHNLIVKLALDPVNDTPRLMMLKPTDISDIASSQHDTI